MLPGEITNVHYLLSTENQITCPVSFGMMQTNPPPLQYNRFLNNMLSSQLLPLGHHEFTTQTSSLSNNSTTSDEAEEQQQHRIIDERKQRRMISNRESARRSRMRKQRHLDELCSQVLRLRNENQLLIDRLNHVCESHDKVLQENARLKEEVSDLRQMFSDMQLDSPFTNVLRNLVEVPCNKAHLRAESSSQSVNNSANPSIGFPIKRSSLFVWLERSGKRITSVEQDNRDNKTNCGGSAGSSGCYHANITTVRSKTSEKAIHLKCLSNSSFVVWASISCPTMSTNLTSSFYILDNIKIQEQLMFQVFLNICFSTTTQNAMLCLQYHRLSLFHFAACVFNG